MVLDYGYNISRKLRYGHGSSLKFYSKGMNMCIVYGFRSTFD